MKLISKSFLVFVVAFGIYHLFLISLKGKPPEDNYQSWWQGNLAKAQKFVYQEKTDSILLVGSSMSANLDLNKGEPFVYNLSLIGGSSLTGLEILKQSKKTPQILIIEMNWIDRFIDGSMVNQLFNPTLSFFRKNLPGLQEAQQPANVLGNALQSITPIKKIDTELHLDSLKFTETVNKNAASDNNIDSLALSEFLKQTATYVHYFRTKGIKVFYLMIPVHQKIENTKKYQIIKAFLQQQPEEKIAFSIKQQLNTTDGYHFDKASATLYSSYLKKYLSHEIH